MSHTTPWQKATASDAHASCVEVRRRGELIEVRDSKAGGTGPVLSFTFPEFAAWLDGAKREEFDHLARP